MICPMTSFPKNALFATVLGAALVLGGQVMAQSSQDMSLLTAAERKAFSDRLQLTPTSAERAKITAEMNRIVQERRLDQRPQKPATLAKP